MKTPFFVCLLAYLLSGSIPMAAQTKKEADDAYERGDFLTATPIYTALLEDDPDNSEFNTRAGRGYMYTFTAPRKALDYLLKAEKTVKRPKDLYLDIAKAQSFHLEYAKALEYLDKFRDAGGINKRNREQVEKMRLDYLAAIDLLKHPVSLDFFNPGPDINSPYADYYPFVTKDGNTLFLTSRRPTRANEKPEFDGYFPSDIYKVDFGGKGVANPLGSRVNSSYDEQVVSITDSGDSLFIYIDHVANYGDVYVSALKGDTYQKPKSVGRAVNTNAIESACAVSPDGNTLYFSSDRSGGYGGLDLWKVEKGSNGKWKDATNLGAEVNSEMDEDYPNLARDGQTLYFTSNGQPGMGGFDLFFSTYDSTSSAWTVPQNAGYPLNTPFDDKSISFERFGNRAYITATRPGGVGDLDVYRVDYQTVVDTTAPAIFLVNIPSIPPENAPEIQIRDKDNRLIGTYLPHPLTHRYVFALYPGRYTLSVSAPGYLPYSEVLRVNNTHLRQKQNVRIINPVRN